MASKTPQEFDESSADAFLQQYLPAARQQTGASAPAAGSSALRLPLLGLNAIVGGVNQLVGLPGAISQLGNQAFTGAANFITGQNLPTPQAFGTPEQLFSVTNALGLTNRPDATPTTPAERYITAAVEGAIPGVLGGFPGVLAGAAGGVAGEAGGPVVGGATGLAAGVGIGGVTGLVRNALLGRNLARTAQESEAAAQQAAAAAEAAKDAKYFGPRERKALAEQHNAGVQQQLDDIANQMGISQTKEDAGMALQEHARNWLDNIFPQKANMLAEPLDAAIPAGASVDLAPYRGVLQSITSKAGDLQGSANVVRNPTAKRLLDALDARTEMESLASGGAAGAPSTASWQNARALRSEIGDALANPKLASSLGEKDLEAAYSGLTKSLSNTAAEHGAGDLWNQYNTGMSQLYSFIKGPLSKVIKSGSEGRESISPAQAYSASLSLAGKGGSTLAALRAEMPEAVNEIAATVVRNPSEWAKLAPEARQALLPGAQAATVDSLLGSKLELAAAHEAAENSAADLVRATSRSAQTASERAAAAKAAFAEHQMAQRAGNNDLMYKLAGAMIGAHEGATMFGTNPLVGALGGFAMPALARGLSQGTRAALAPNQLAIPALGTYTGAYGQRTATPQE